MVFRVLTTDLVCLYCLLLIASCGSRSSADEAAVAGNEEAVQGGPVSSDSLTDEIVFINVEHIFLAAEASGADSSGVAIDRNDEAYRTLRDIRYQIESGEATFQEMAARYSQCTSASDSGRLPPFTSGGITWELDSAAATLMPGEMSGIVRTRFGYHLLRRLGS